MIEQPEVIRRVLGGEVDCFRPLVQRYQQPIASMVGNIVSDRHGCEDLVQDVFLTAFDRLGSFDPRRGKFST